MSVIVRPLIINPGSLNGPVSFTDTMNRASGPLGENWLTGIQNAAGAPNFVAIPAFEIAVSSIDGNPCGKFSTINSAVGTVWYTAIQPLVPIGLRNRSQFSQWTCVVHDKPGAGNDVFAGITVLQTMPGIGTGDSDCSAYILQFATATATAVIIRRNKSVQTGLTAGVAYAAGDVFRLTAVINTANVTLTVLKNGTQVDSVVDAAAGRLTTGMPGLMGTSLNNVSANYRSEWRNFSCGPA